MNLEHIMQSERSQTQKDKYSIIPFTWNVQNRQIHKDRNQISGEELAEVTTNGYSCFADDENVLKLDSGDDCTTL